MKTVLILLVLLFAITTAFSQEYRDTTFNVRGHSCTCKYTTDEESVIFDRLAKDAYYPGGESEWKKFVKKNLDKGFKRNDEVMIRFQVDRNGDLSGFTLLSRSPNQKFEEVVRILKLSGKWFPSVQKGFCVKSHVRLTFEL